MKKIIEPSILLLIALVGFPQISETIYTPSLPDLAHYFGIGNALVNLTLSIYFVGFALGVLLWGRLADKFGRRPAMLWGIAIYIIGCIFCYFSSTISVLVFARFIQALGASAGSVVTQTIMRDIYSGQRRSQVFSIISGAIAFSPALGPFIGGYIAEIWGFQTNFLALLIMGIWLFCSTFNSLPETKQGNAVFVNMFELSKKMVADKSIWAFSFLIAACNGIIFSYYGEAPFLFTEILGFSSSQYGMFGLTVALPILFASILSHRLNKHLDSESVIKIGALTLLGGVFLLVAVGNLISAEHGLLGVISLVVPMMIVFTGVGIMIPNCISLALQAYQTVLGSAGAFFGLMYYLMIGAMTELMGVFHNGSIWPMALYFLVLAFMMHGVCTMRKPSVLCRGAQQKNI
ncbi:MAG: multidrug effflux MFS transporter [Myxococcales bacterium]|nr:multidrug effflux MFS transporter [Myxococcales bacterium]